MICIVFFQAVDRWQKCIDNLEGAVSNPRECEPNTLVLTKLLEEYFWLLFLLQKSDTGTVYDGF